MEQISERSKKHQTGQYADIDLVELPDMPSTQSKSIRAKSAVESFGKNPSLGNPEKDVNGQTLDRHILRKWIVQSSEDSPYCGIEKFHVLLPKILMEQTLPAKSTCFSLRYLGDAVGMDPCGEDEGSLVSGAFAAGASACQDNIALCGAWQDSIQPKTYPVWPLDHEALMDT